MYCPLIRVVANIIHIVLVSPVSSTAVNHNKAMHMPVKVIVHQPLENLVVSNQSWDCVGGRQWVAQQTTNETTYIISSTAVKESSENDPGNFQFISHAEVPLSACCLILFLFTPRAFREWWVGGAFSTSTMRVNGLGPDYGIPSTLCIKAKNSGICEFGCILASATVWFVMPFDLSAIYLPDKTV